MKPSLFCWLYLSLALLATLCAIALAATLPAETCTGPVLCGRFAAQSRFLDSSESTNNLIIRYNKLQATTTAVDVIVYFHGNLPCNGANFGDAWTNDKEDSSGLALNERFRDIPTVALFPRGIKNGPKPDAAGCAAHGWPISHPIYEGGSQFNAFLSDSLAAVKQRAGVTGDLRIGRLIISGHSRGGSTVAAGVGRKSNRKPDQIWIFDGLYSSAEQVRLWILNRTATATAALNDTTALQGLSPVDWMELKGPSFRNFVLTTATHSNELNPALNGLSSDLKAFFRSQSTPIPHNDIPGTFGPCVIRNPNSCLTMPSALSGTPVPTPPTGGTVECMAHTGFCMNPAANTCSVSTVPRRCPGDDICCPGTITPKAPAAPQFRSRRFRLSPSDI